MRKSEIEMHEKLVGTLRDRNKKLPLILLSRCSEMCQAIIEVLQGSPAEWFLFRYDIRGISNDDGSYAFISKGLEYSAPSGIEANAILSFLLLVNMVDDENFETGEIE